MKSLCRYIAVLCVLFMTASLFADDRHDKKEEPLNEHQLAALVNKVVGPWKQQNAAPGVMVVIRINGKTMFFPLGEADQANHKPVTPDSIFELASITKVFTTTSLAMGVNSGKLQLNDTVGKTIPYLREHGGDIKGITLQQLATHTSGLPRMPGRLHPGPQTKQDVLEWLAQWHITSPAPGTKDVYSNLGVGLLGYALEDVYKQPLMDLWSTQFLGPLGMQHTFFDVPDSSREFLVQGYNPRGKPVDPAPVAALPAAGRLKSSGRDMGIFLAASLGEISNAVVMNAMQLAQKPYFPASPRMTQGLAWQLLNIQGEKVIDKNGGLAGTSTYIGLLPEWRMGVVVMANKGKCGATAVGRKLLLALVDKHPGNRPEDQQDQEGQ
jgi:beta-lactamase class C